MILSTLGTIIATRTLTLADTNDVTVTIGKPEKFPDGDDYYCPYQIIGIGSGKVKYAAGVDAVQALSLTLKKVGTDLYTSDECKAGTLQWEAGQKKGDLGFPVPEALRDLVP